MSGQLFVRQNLPKTALFYRLPVTFHTLLTALTAVMVSYKRLLFNFFYLTSRVHFDYKCHTNINHCFGDLL